jgi:NAD(P)H-hydrate repair Nnr-like enzyme with NAD(P)H-hydrate dehydratase domain
MRHAWCSTPTRSTPWPPTPRCAPPWPRAAAAVHRRVLTPHPLEAGRLLGRSVGEVQADRPGAARALAAAFGAVLVLKGSGTLIASPDGRMAVNATGNARLASAGTGDVLAGWLGGHWARSGASAQDAAGTLPCFAMGWRPNRHAGRGPLLAADLIGAMQALD